jgi:hypothetical protein
MNNVKNVFSIKDLENLSGIKAHTIHLGKTFDICSPCVRILTFVCMIGELTKLLNITLLHDYGYKISK